MPPNSEYVHPSTLGIVPPKDRNKGFKLSGDLWLKEKKDTDGADGLWRIEDEIYDFSEFIGTHPGGDDWLELTKVKIKIQIIFVFIDINNKSNALINFNQT